MEKRRDERTYNRLNGIHTNPMKNIYLDVCSLCRPFDNQDYARIRIETDAVNMILSRVKSKQYSLIVSPAHIVEIKGIADDFERLNLFRLLDSYGKRSKVEREVIIRRIDEFTGLGFGIADATHVAFAEFNRAVFITCDDRLLNKCIKKNVSTLCVNPVAFCEMEKLR